MSEAPPAIVYVPGLKPKPAPEAHHSQLLRCLVEGVRRSDPVLADSFATDSFELIDWTWDFYGEHRDINIDLAAIDAVVQQQSASAEDMAIATSWKRRLAIGLFILVDHMPFSLTGLATDEIEIHLRDYFRYVRNENGEAETARQKLKQALVGAHDEGRRVLLIGHSMGSVIAYDALWQLSREQDSEFVADLFLTAGSPLGQKTVQRNLLGRGNVGEARFPDNIRRWVNVAAFGEMTAIDRNLCNDFAEMIRLGLIPAIEDRDCYNWFRLNGALRVHSEYGYLVNEVTASEIVNWLRA